MAALEKLKPNGLFGFLLPKVFIKNESYRTIREKVLNEYEILKIIDFGQFPGVASDAIGLVLKKNKKSALTKIAFFDGMKLKRETTIEQKVFGKNASAVFSIMINNDIQKILDKITKNSTELSKILKIKRGIELGQKSYIVKCGKCGVYNEAETKYYGSAEKTCKSCGAKLTIDKQNTIQISSLEKKKEYTQEGISGSQLQRYAVTDNYYIRTGLQGIDYKLDAFTNPKILIKRISTQIEGTYFEDKLLAFNTVYSIYGNNYNKEKLLPILGILNSNLMHFFYEFSYNVGMSLTTQLTIDFLSRIPLKEGDTNQNKQLVNLVADLLSLNERLRKMKNTDEKAKLEEKREMLDNEIDGIVYKIYGITEEEKKTIKDNIID